MEISSVKPVKCPQCGGSVKLDYPSSFVSCPFCGTTLSINFKGSYSSTRMDFEPDNPTEIIISKTDSFVIEINGIFIPPCSLREKPSKQDYQRINSEVQEYFFLLAAISHFEKKSMQVILRFPGFSNGIGKVGYCSLSYDKINWKNKMRYDRSPFDKDESENTLEYVAGLKKILKNNGFSISEYWVESDYRVSIEDHGRNFLRKQYIKYFYEKCFLEGTTGISSTSLPYDRIPIKPHIERIKANDVIATISQSISTLLAQEEKQIETNLNHVTAKKTISLTKNSIGLLFHPISFHSIGMSEISDLRIMESLAAIVLNEILNSHNNWGISSVKIDPRLESMSISTDLSYKYTAQKVYKSW